MDQNHQYISLFCFPLRYDCEKDCVIFARNVQMKESDFLAGGMQYYVAPMFELCRKLKGAIQVSTFDSILMERRYKNSSAEVQLAKNPYHIWNASLHSVLFSCVHATLLYFGLSDRLLVGRSIHWLKHY